MFTSGRGEQGCGPWCSEVGSGSSSIGAKSQHCAGGGSRVNSTSAGNSADYAAHVAHVGHVGQVADAAATVAADVVRVER